VFRLEPPNDELRLIGESGELKRNVNGNLSRLDGMLEALLDLKQQRRNETKWHYECVVCKGRIPAKHKGQMPVRREN
jgi:hypothetical protein